jgi:thiol peroxidase
MERKNVVTMGGAPVTLTGNPVGVGDKAPDFTVLTPDMKAVSLSHFKNNILVISVAPSIDTPVCDLQATRFNQEANSLPDDVRVLNITVDLPFALGRFCAAKGIDKVLTLSDHRDLSFGNAYGVVVKEFRLLARSIFIVDRDGIVRYVELVTDIKNHPDYEKALAEVRKLL